LLGVIHASNETATVAGAALYAKVTERAAAASALVAALREGMLNIVSLRCGF